jgi:hypothetical protein
VPAQTNTPGTTARSALRALGYFARGIDLLHDQVVGVALNNSRQLRIFVAGENDEHPRLLAHAPEDAQINGRKPLRATVVGALADKDRPLRSAPVLSSSRRAMLSLTSRKIASFRDPDNFLTAPGHEIKGTELQTERPDYAIRRSSRGCGKTKRRPPLSLSGRGHGRTTRDPGQGARTLSLEAAIRSLRRGLRVAHSWPKRPAQTPRNHAS